jgi:hypothetical protein
MKTFFFRQIFKIGKENRSSKENATTTRTKVPNFSSSRSSLT